MSFADVADTQDNIEAACPPAATLEVQVETPDIEAACPSAATLEVPDFFGPLEDPPRENLVPPAFAASATSSLRVKALVLTTSAHALMPKPVLRSAIPSMNATRLGRMQRESTDADGNMHV